MLKKSNILCCKCSDFFRQRGHQKLLLRLDHLKQPREDKYLPSSHLEALFLSISIRHGREQRNIIQRQYTKRKCYWFTVKTTLKEKNGSMIQMEITEAQDHNNGDGGRAANSKTFKLITEFEGKH